MCVTPQKEALHPQQHELDLKPEQEILPTYSAITTTMAVKGDSMHLHVVVFQHPAKQAHNLIACWTAGNLMPDGGGYLEISYCAIGC